MGSKSLSKQYCLHCRKLKKNDICTIRAGLSHSWLIMLVLWQRTRPNFGFGVAIVTSTSDALSSFSPSPCLYVTSHLRNSRTWWCTYTYLNVKLAIFCVTLSTISVWSTPKADRASVVGDAIGYIKELLRTVNELKMLVKRKSCSIERIKRHKTESDGPDHQDQSSYNGLRSSWLQRKFKDSEIDVRIVDDEVTIKFAHPQKKINCLLPVSKALDELQLDIQHVGGGLVGDNYCFLFNTKVDNLFFFFYYFRIENHSHFKYHPFLYVCPIRILTRHRIGIFLSYLCTSYLMGFDNHSKQ